MEVILLADVAKLGRRYEVKKVADGFGHNFLIARGKAIAATPAALAKLKVWQTEQTVHEKVQADLAAKTFAALKNQTINLKAKANDEGHLFAGLRAVELVAAIKKIAGIDLDAAWLDLPKPIKHIGPHTINLKTGGLIGLLNVVIDKL